MGEVKVEERVLKVRQNPRPGADKKSARLEFESDYLGRINQIIYPDGEVVEYGYDEGGQLREVKGTRNDNGNTDVRYFVKNIGYDAFGQRTFIVYGNNTRTDYAYNPYRRWLESLKTHDSSHRLQQNLSYSFDTVGNVLSRRDDNNDCTVEQSYSYDELYQLTGAEGRYNSHRTGEAFWERNYTQSFVYDDLFNMSSQTATERKTPIEGGFRGITGSLNYEYDPLKPHQATKVGQYYYSYDANGNVISESENPCTPDEMGMPTLYGEVRSSAPAWGVYAEQPQDEGYVRYFRWDEENRLKSVREGEDVTSFHYDADGIRTSKVGKFGESFYFSAWWSSHSEAAGGYRNSKHIFVGSERVVTSQSVDGSGYGWTFEDHNSYWYHPDHLGSTALVTDSGGNPYERMDYLAYGQSWVEKKYERPPDGSSGNGKIYHRFTSKEWDEETGLYAFPKRYYEPRLARWMSVDPAGFELASPMERGQNGALQPKSGYSVIEALNHYSYCSNNPILYTDPTGLSEIVYADTTKYTDHNMTESKYFNQQQFADAKDQKFSSDFYKTACAATSLLNELSTEYTSITGEQLTNKQATGMMNAAIDAGMIKGDNAFVKDWAGAANAMWGSLGLEGEWSFSNDGFHTIVAWDKTGSGYVNHFVNALPGGTSINDVWSGAILPFSNITTATEGLGRYRVLDFNL